MNRMLSQFLSDTVVALGLGSAVNVLNYFFVLLAARGLSTEDFGTCSALLACVTISMVVGNALQLRVTQTVGEERAGSLKVYTRRILCWLLALGIGFGIGIALLREVVEKFLHASSFEVAFTAFAIVGTLLFGFGNGLTAGLRRLKAQAWIGFAATVVKLLLLAAFLSLGWGVSGVLSAYALGVWLVLPLSLLVVRNFASPAPRDAMLPNHRGAGMVVFIVYFLVTAPFMLDQILVQVLAQPLSGYYGAAATLGKLGFYGCAPIFSVIFPYLVSHRHDRRAQGRYFALGGGAVFCLALAVAVVLAAESERSVSLFFSPEYSRVAPIVGTIGFAVLLYVVAYFMTIVSIARGERGVVFPLIVGLGLQVVLFCERHDSIEVLAMNQVWSYGALAGLLVLRAIVVRLYDRGGAPPQSMGRQNSDGKTPGKTLVYLHPHFTIAGGAGKYVLETGRRFAEQGYTVVVVSIRAEEAIVGAYKGALQFVDIGGPLSSSLWFWVLFPRSVLRVWRILRRYPGAIVFAQVFPANWWGFIYKLFHRQQLLVWMCQEPSAFIHSRSWLAALPRSVAASGARFFNPLLRRIDVALAQTADLVFTNSQFGRRYAEDVYRYPSERIVATYLGVDRTLFSPSREAPQQQIISVCRLTEFKRLDMILRALRIVHDRGYRGLRFVIIGRGEAEQSLRLLVRELSLEGAVVFRGAVSDDTLIGELRRSLALVLASVEEPFGLVAVEAMACGTPAIVTATGGPAETVLDGVSGFLVPPNDPVALADRIEQLCREPELQAKLKDGALQRAREFTWDETVANSRRCIEAIL